MTIEPCLACVAGYRKAEQPWLWTNSNRILYNITGKAICSVTRAPFDLRAYKLDQLYVPIYFSLKCRIFIYTFRYVSLTQRENTTSNQNATAATVAEERTRSTFQSLLSFLIPLNFLPFCLSSLEAGVKFLIISKPNYNNCPCYQNLIS